MLTLVRAALIATLAGLIGLAPTLLVLDIRPLSTLCSVVAGLALYCTASVGGRGPWSIGLWFLGLLVLFHLGIPFLIAVGWYHLPPAYSQYYDTWFNGASYRNEAILLATIGIVSFAALYAIFSRGKVREHDLGDRQAKSGPTHASVACGMIIGGVALIFVHVALTAPSLFVGGTRSLYLETVEGTPAQGVGMLLILFGTLLLATETRPSRARRVALVVLAIFAIWCFSVGARTLIMYTCLAAVLIYARRTKMPSGWAAIALAVSGLIVVALVGSFRLAGVQSSTITTSEADPRIAIVEMGGSLRPLMEVISIHRTEGAPFSGGVTYIAWPARLFESALGTPHPVDTLDPRYAQNEFRGRFDGFQIGYSAVGEAYRNGGMLGVLIVFGIFGALLGVIDRWRLASRAAGVMAGALAYSLLYHVRQPSITMFSTLLFGCGVAWLVSKWERRSSSLADKSVVHA